MLQYFVVFFNISPPTKKSAVLKLRLSKQKCILTIKEENIYDVLTILLIYTVSRFKCYKKNEVFSGIKKISTQKSPRIGFLPAVHVFITNHQQSS
jgi:hypothetical protein